MNIDANTTFSIGSNNVDLTGLPFTPTFSRSSLFQGQSVEVASSSGMSHDGDGHDMHHGTTAASVLYLEEQGIRGVVSNYAATGSQATFTLTVASDSAIAKLAGTTTITVYQQATTQISGGSTLKNGVTVIAHGLLFVNAGKYQLVTSRIIVP